MKFFRYGLAVLLGFLSLGFSWASFSYNDFVAQFTKASAGLSLTQKKTYYTKIYNNLSLLAIRNRKDTTQFNLYTSLKTYISSQIKTLGTGSVSPSPSSSVSSSGMSIPKVDLARVRDTWLSLHNTERATKKLTPFTYNPSLEKTATTWATYLANSGKTKGLHKRPNSNVFYSYSIIQQWFLNQGIIFADNDGTFFSESIGRNFYTCKKTDCTDTLISAIKKTRRLFMSEKPSGPHYNAIVGKFTNIGLGVVVSGNKYYLVTHYTQDLK